MKEFIDRIIALLDSNDSRGARRTFYISSIPLMLGLNLTNPQPEWVFAFNVSIQVKNHLLIAPLYLTFLFSSISFFRTHRQYMAERDLRSDIGTRISGKIYKIDPRSENECKRLNQYIHAENMRRLKVGGDQIEKGVWTDTNYVLEISDEKLDDFFVVNTDRFGFSKDEINDQRSVLSNVAKKVEKLLMRKKGKYLMNYALFPSVYFGFITLITVWSFLMLFKCEVT